MATSLPISPYYPDMRPTLPYQATPSYNTAAPLTAPRGTGISNAGTWRPVQTTPVGPRDNMLTMPLFGTDVPRNTSGGFVPPTMTPAMYSTTGIPGRRLMADGFGTLPFPLAYPNNPPVDITVRGGNTQVAQVPLPRPRPATAGAGINFAGLRDAQAEYGVHDPAMPPQPPMSAYAPQPPMNPAVASATNVAQGQPQTSWLQDAITGLGTLFPGSGLNSTDPNKLLTPSQEYDAKNAFATGAAQGRDRSGVGTDGYVRDAAGNVTGLADWAQGLSPAEQYAWASNIGVDNSWKTIGSSASTNPDRWQTAGFGSQHDYRRALADFATSNGMQRGPKASAAFLNSLQSPPPPVTAGPMLAPVTGGMMAPARVANRNRAPIMRRA